MEMAMKMKIIQTPSEKEELSINESDAHEDMKMKMMMKIDEKKKEFKPIICDVNPPKKKLVKKMMCDYIVGKSTDYFLHGK
ncbi:hypothetical protein CsatB_024947 [Cannabis sativa]